MSMNSPKWQQRYKNDINNFSKMNCTKDQCNISGGKCHNNAIRTNPIFIQQQAQTDKDLAISCGLLTALFLQLQSIIITRCCTKSSREITFVLLCKIPTVLHSVYCQQINMHNLIVHITSVNVPRIKPQNTQKVKM